MFKLNMLNVALSLEITLSLGSHLQRVFFWCWFIILLYLGQDAKGHGTVVVLQWGNVVVAKS